MAQSLIPILSVVVALGLLNVWLVRANRPTAYRGGAAGNLRDEFSAYGLPPVAFYLVGFLKITSALALLAGLWIPQLVFPAAALVAVLMAGAVIMHFKVRDPIVKAVPAGLMFLMSLLVCAAQS